MRHRSRHLHATFLDLTISGLTTLGWITSPVIFGTTPVTIVDYQPDVRGVAIAPNTVAVTLGDAPADSDEELGGQSGGLRSGFYPIFFDAYMVEESLSLAMCDDIRQLFDLKIGQVVDHATGTPDPQVQYQVEEMFGPEEPASLGSAEQFKKNWRVMRAGVRVYYQT